MAADTVDRGARAAAEIPARRKDYGVGFWMTSYEIGSAATCPTNEHFDSTVRSPH
jgi:hypothetical protein